MNAIACFNQANATPATLTQSTGAQQRSVAHEPVDHDSARMAGLSFNACPKPDSWKVAAFATPPRDGQRIPSSPLHEF